MNRCVQFTKTLTLEGNGILEAFHSFLSQKDRRVIRFYVFIKYFLTDIWRSHKILTDPWGQKKKEENLTDSCMLLLFSTGKKEIWKTEEEHCGAAVRSTIVKIKVYRCF